MNRLANQTNLQQCYRYFPFLLFSIAVLASGQTRGLPIAERLGQDKVRIHWFGPAIVDIYVSAKPDATIADATLVAHSNAAGVYDFAGHPDSRPYFILHDEADGVDLRVAERVLPLERGSNFRDLGGYPGANNKRTRWGMIYRTAAGPMLTHGDLLYLKELGIGTDVDLRSSDERAVSPDLLPDKIDVRYVFNDYRFSIPENAYRDWLTSLAPEFRAVFQALLHADGATSFHCSAGQDRTGIATSLVLSALGVPRDVIFEDYLLSMRYRRPRFEFQKLSPAKYPGNAFVQFVSSIPDSQMDKPPSLYDAEGVPLLEQSFNEIERRWGSVQNYLKDVLGIGPGEIAKLQAIYLE